jgi:predicted amidohydrolase
MRVSVAVAQIPVCWAVSRNTATVVEMIGQVEAGTVLVLPECALSGYDDQLSGLDDLDPGELATARDAVSAAAVRANVHVVCGSLLFDRERWWNAAIYFSPAGQAQVYRKVNLATHERGRLAAGSALPLMRMTVPRGTMQAGVQLCREIRFPEQWNCLARQGAEALIYMTYAVNPGEPAGVWRAHLVSRAAETQRFVLAANVAGDNQHCPSMIVSPRGEVLAETRAGAPAILRRLIDLADIRDSYLSQQRGDVVETSYRPAAIN